MFHALGATPSADVLTHILPSTHRTTVLDGGRRGRKDDRKTYLDLALREPTQVMCAMLLEAPCPERARGIHACPIMMTCVPRQLVEPVRKESTGLGEAPSPRLCIRRSGTADWNVGEARRT